MPRPYIEFTKGSCLSRKLTLTLCKALQGALPGLQWQNFEHMGSLPACDVRMGRTGGELDYLYTPSAADLGPQSPEAKRLQALRCAASPLGCCTWGSGILYQHLPKKCIPDQDDWSVLSCSDDRHLTSCQEIFLQPRTLPSHSSALPSLVWLNVNLQRPRHAHD